MPVKKFPIQFWIVLILWLYAGVMTACTTTEAEPTLTPGVHTWLLVKAPENPLPLDQPVNVRSRTEDGQVGVSHVELYAIELPSGETNVLIRADAAPFDQTSFTVSQTFTPIERGHYAVQVMGYNNLGEKSESNIIGFDVE